MPWKRMLAYVTGEVEESLLVRIEYLIEENRAIRNLGYSISDQTVGNILKRNGIARSRSLEDRSDEGVFDSSAGRRLF